MVYAIHILDLVIFKFCTLEKKLSLDELEIHVHSMAFQDNYSITLKRHWHDLLSDRICKVYTRYIPCIYYTYTMRRSHPCLLTKFLVAHPRLEASELDFLWILATERPPMRGWGRPKFHNQVLIS